jgi:hypothetical protein
MKRVGLALTAAGLVCIVVGLVLGFRAVHTQSNWYILIGDPQPVSCGSAFQPDDTAARADQAHRNSGPFTRHHPDTIARCNDARHTATIEAASGLTAGVVLVAGGALLSAGGISRRRAKPPLVSAVSR